jgi:hypothetical protein
MPHIKAVDADWQEMARTLASHLQCLPFIPDLPESLGLGATPFRELREHIDRSMRLLRDQIALHLAYRMRVVHGVKRNYKNGMFILESPDEPQLTEIYEQFERWGFLRLDDIDRAALKAHDGIVRVLKEGCVGLRMRSELPLEVAAIGGARTGRAASSRTSKVRVRRGGNKELMDAKQARRLAYPSESWKEQLAQLEGDGIVVRWDREKIEWVSSQGDIRTVKTGTYRNW